MPLSKDIVTRLAKGDLKFSASSASDYTNKIPTLGEDVIPDDISIWDASASGGEVGRKIHELLDQAGLTKGQRSGMTHLLDTFVKIGDSELKVGDIRALTEDELMKLRGEFSYGKPSTDSVKKIKKLFG